MKLSALWQSPSPFKTASDSEITLFNKHVGSSIWWKELYDKGGDADVEGFLANWRANSKEFQKKIKAYYLY